MERSQFEQLVAEGIDAIPEEFIDKLDNVEIVVADWPSPHQARKLHLHNGQLLFGLYEGIPPIKRRNYSGVLPDKITIFQKPIEQLARNEEHLREIVKNTVWHEIAHHFGLTEEEVRRAEAARSKQ